MHRNSGLLKNSDLINGEPRRDILNGEFWLDPAGIILGRQLVDIAIASPLIVV
ncbi:MAG TPA: hypothetical protein PL168_06180 [Methanobacterium sp.]|nr:hypothetical protein [Methanobacterium sp.]